MFRCDSVSVFYSSHSIRWVFATVALGTASLSDGQAPIDGYLPFVGFGITNEYNEDFVFSPEPSGSPEGATLLGAGGTPFFDVALLDTGAGFSLLTDQAFRDFGLDGPSVGEPDGYVGTEFVPISGATGSLNVPINDPFGLYASGLQDRSGEGAALTMNTASLPGQTNTSTVTFPPDSELPNVIGLPFASQYATHIRSDDPQVFQLGGETVRTPAVSFETLGSGGGEIVRKAPVQLNPGTSFAQPPSYLLNIIGFDIDNPQENPSLPTVTQGALFLNVDASNDGVSLNAEEFFFDTGASVTVVSQFKALQLGFDVVLDDPEFTISIVGSGGVLDNVPGFFVDEISILAFGGNVTATDVPVIVLDVPNPADPSNVVDGIIGTNLLAGRNVVIDPNPSTGLGESAGLYLSDPVTTPFEWSTAEGLADWESAGSWDAAATPDLLSQALLRNASPFAQQAIVVGSQQAWDLFVAGDSAEATMTLRFESAASLTTFSGTTIVEHGVVSLGGGVLDTQFVDIRGGRLTGSGSIETGSGPIDGQVESNGGVVAPGDGVGRLTIGGRFNNINGAIVEIEIGGVVAGAEHDQLVVEGVAALGGVLRVTLTQIDSGNFIPSAGDVFDVITYESLVGQFETVSLPLGYQWDVDYLSDSLRLTVLSAGIPGDFNLDGAVDIQDYAVWRENLGVTTTASDYAVWRENYGASGAPTAIAVPEPATRISALACCFVSRRRRRSLGERPR